LETGHSSIRKTEAIKERSQAPEWNIRSKGMIVNIGLSLAHSSASTILTTATCTHKTKSNHNMQRIRINTSRFIDASFAAKYFKKFHAQISRANFIANPNIAKSSSKEKGNSSTFRKQNENSVRKI
jgi:hypothetical protein